MNRVDGRGVGARVRGQRILGAERLERRDLLAVGVVTSLPLPNAVEGTPLVQQQVATFTSTTAGASTSLFAASVDWGDGSAPTAGTVTARADGSFGVAASHVYATSATYVVTVAVTESGTPPTSGTGSTTATVLDAPLQLTALPLTATKGDVPPLGTPVAAFSVANPAATAARYTATVDWGDGIFGGATVLPSGVAFPGTGSGGTASTSYVVYAARPAFTSVGTFATRVTVTEASPSASQSTAGATLTVKAIPIVATALSTSPVDEGTPFSGNLVGFSAGGAGSPLTNSSDFTAVIDWGDGTPLTGGRVFPGIPAPGATFYPFYVSGTHVYADALSTVSTTRQVHVTIRSVDGAEASLNTTIVVRDVPIDLSGQLDAQDDSGVSDSDGITSVKTPRFSGFSEPGSVVAVFATAGGTSTPIYLGSTVTDASGAWKVRSRLLGDGRYVVVATAVDAAGITTAVQTLMGADKPLVIDTVGPRVTGVIFGRLSGQLQVTFQDNASGLDTSTLQDASNYGFRNPRHSGRAYLVNQLPLNPGANPTDPVSVLVTLNGGQAIRGGNYALTVRSGGVRDVAGNALDGEYYGRFPSGNGRPGGDFAANIRAIHRRVYPPTSTVGNASPLPSMTPAAARARAAAVKAHRVGPRGR